MELDENNGLVKALAELYGIHTYGDLIRAIEKQEVIDIGIFTGGYRKKEGGEHEMRG